MKKKNKSDPYSRVDYRRFVAWPERICREAPFLQTHLEKAPVRTLIDLGCGTGEHSRFFAAQDWSVLGIDHSESMISEARSEARMTRKNGKGRINFRKMDLVEIGSLKDRFGAAICLGNTLAHLTEPAELERLLAALRERLEPAGVFIFQILNYQRLITQGIRFLPLNFQAGEGEELVFLRLMEFGPEGRVIFCPSTLSYAADRDSPLQVLRSRVVNLRAWTRVELNSSLRRAGFSVKWFGTLTGSPFRSRTSHDLVGVAELKALGAG